jgi:PAS domain S-box-containing protein
MKNVLSREGELGGSAVSANIAVARVMKPFPRWMIVALMSAFAFLLVGGFWFYHSQKQAVQRAAIEQLDLIGGLKADQVAVFRKERLADASVLMESPFLARGVAVYLTNSREENVQPILSHFRSLQTHYPYSEILLVDVEGRCLLSRSGKNNIAYSGYKQALVKALQESKPVFSELHIEEQTRQPKFSVVAPLYVDAKPDESPLGAIVLVCEASQFLYPLLQSWPTPSKTAETLVVRRDGEDVLFLNDLRHQPDTALKLRIPLRRTEVPAVAAVLGQQGLFWGKDYRDIEVVSVAKRIPDSAWIVISKQDVVEVLAVWRFRALMILVLLAVLTGGIGAIGLFAWQWHKKVHFQTMYDAEAKWHAEMERHSVTLAAIGDAVIATDAEGRVELLNKTAEALTGWTLEEAQNRSMAEVFRVVNEETRAVVPDPVSLVLAKGKVVGLANHTLLIAKDGSERAIADSAAPIFDEEGRHVRGVVVVFRDVTDERAAERALRESEEKHRALFESSWDAIMTLAPPDWKFTSGNPATIAMFQAKDERDFTARGPWEVSPEYQPDGRPSGEKAKEMIEKAVREGMSYFEWTHRRLSGEDFPATVLLARVVVKGETCLQATVRDLSKQARMAQSLRDSEELFRSLTAAAQDAIVLTNEGDKVVFWNLAAEKIFGWTEAEALGKSIHQLIAPKDALSHIMEKVSRFRTEGVGDALGKTVELTACRKDGSGFPLELSLSRVETADGWRAIGIARDITARKQTLQQLDEAHRQLQENQKHLLQSEKMAAIGQLAAGVAHEINNPVGFVTSNLGTLSEYVVFFKKLLAEYEKLVALIEPDLKIAPNSVFQERRDAIAALRKKEDYAYVTDDVDKLLAESKDGVERVKNIVQSLKSFARADENKIVEANLNECLEDTLRVIWNELKYKCQVTKKFTALPPLRCWSGELNQVFMNLMVNAAQAIKDWGEVVIETAADEQWLYVRIQDTGQGIPPENIKGHL